MLTVDSSPISTVVTCTYCPYWHAFTWTRGDGWVSAAAHEARVHPEEFQARDNLARHLARHGH